MHQLAPFLLTLAAQPPVTDTDKVVWVITIGFCTIIGLFLIFFLYSYGGLWVKALMSDCYVGISEIVGMRLRGVSSHVIVDAKIMSSKAGLEPVPEVQWLESQPAEIWGVLDAEVQTEGDVGDALELAELA